MHREIIRAAVVLFAGLSQAAGAATTTFASHRCGVAFNLPARWTARATEECDVALRPPAPKRSRWDTAEPALTLILFERGMSFDDALTELDFERDGDRYTISGGYGSTGVAEPYAVGGYSGIMARTFSRVFARDDSEPHAVGRDIEHVVLTTPSGRVIGFQCPGGPPDEPVDCDAVIKQLLRTLVIQ